MMPNFNFLTKGLRAVNYKVIVRNAVKEHEKVVILLQQEQMFHGDDSIGGEIDPKYTPFTIQQKRKKGQPTDRVTLKDTGSFYREMFVKYGREDFIVSSRNRKRLKLERKYGTDIWGLTGASLSILAKEMFPAISFDINEALMSKI
jgi:hypothetical protein